MKHTFLILIVALFSSLVWAQEPPEPISIVLTVDPLQDFQIKFRDGDWEDLVVTEYQVLLGPVTEPHKFITELEPLLYGVTIPGLSNESMNRIEFVVPESVVATYLGLDYWGIIRVRCRLRVVTAIDGVPFISEPTAWLTPRSWVHVVNLAIIETDYARMR